MTCAFALYVPSLVIYGEHAFCFSGLSWAWGQGEGRSWDEEQVWAHGAWSTVTHLSAEST